MVRAVLGLLGAARRVDGRAARSRGAGVPPLPPRRPDRDDRRLPRAPAGARHAPPATTLESGRFLAVLGLLGATRRDDGRAAPSRGASVPALPPRRPDRDDRRLPRAPAGARARLHRRGVVGAAVGGPVG